MLRCGQLRSIGFWSVATVACALTGCSIHPLPDDLSLTKASTFDIVERVRCEVQEGLLSFPQNDRHFRKIVADSNIGYDFTFHMVEMNNADEGKLTAKRVGHGGGSLTLDATGTADLTRDNKRVFRIIEDLKDVASADCSPARRANWVYPITGATGMGEVVRTYIKLEMLSDLKTGATDAPTITSNIVFADSLTFTTHFNVGIAPTLVLSAGVASLKVTNASVKASADRMDTHSLIVALARDHPDLDVDDVGTMRGRGKAFQREKLARVERKELIETDVLRDERQVRALVQKNSGARNRILIELQRLRDLQDDAREAPRILGQRLLDLLRLP
jgi:hypothetical protein